MFAASLLPTMSMPMPMPSMPMLRMSAVVPVENNNNNNNNNHPGWREYDFLQTTNSVPQSRRYQNQPIPRVIEVVNNSKMPVLEHRISCHRCGNIRKRRTLCPRPTCPHTFCGRCTEKLVVELGNDVFEDGCPVCKELCCCSNKSVSCDRKNHCYRKCPATKSAGKSSPVEDKAATCFEESAIIQLKGESDAAKDESNATVVSIGSSSEESVVDMPTCVPCERRVKKKPRTTYAAPSSNSSGANTLVFQAPSASFSQDLFYVDQFPSRFVTGPYWKLPEGELFDGARGIKDFKRGLELEQILSRSSYALDHNIDSNSFRKKPKTYPVYAPPPVYSIPTHCPIYDQEDDKVLKFRSAASLRMPHVIPSETCNMPTNVKSMPRNIADMGNVSVPSNSEGAMALLAMVSSYNYMLEQAKTDV